LSLLFQDQTESLELQVLKKQFLIKSDCYVDFFSCSELPVSVIQHIITEQWRYTQRVPLVSSFLNLVRCGYVGTHDSRQLVESAKKALVVLLISFSFLSRIKSEQIVQLEISNFEFLFDRNPLIL
jgi:hypothetical protein